MATNFPGSLDTSTQQPSPSSSTDMDASGYEHDVVHTNHSGAIIALETKLGTGDSNAVAGAALMGTGSGTSGWSSNPAFSSTGANYIEVSGAGTGYTHSAIHLLADGSTRGAGMYCFNAGTDVTWFTGSPYNDADEWIVGRVSNASFQSSAAAESNGLMKLESDGDLNIDGAYGTFSDSRIKENIADVSLGLNFINSLKPREYTRVGRTRTHMGFVAQEVAAVLPDAASTSLWTKSVSNTAGPDETENLVETQGLRYEEFIAPLVKAVQELTARLEALEG